MTRLIFVLSLVLLPQLALAQSTADAEVSSEKLPIPSWGQGIIDSFSKPLHPVVGGVASGGGVGAGIGYDSPDDTRWYQNAEAMVTVRQYWSLEGEVGRRSITKRSQLGAFAGVRDMRRIDYFGLGPHTAFEDHSVFRLRETSFGARGWHRVTPAIRLGGSAAMYQPDLGSGSHPSVPSIEQVFSESSVPGFSAEPTFGRYRGFAELVYPVLTEAESVDATHRYGATYQVALEAVRDHDSGRYSFHRWETEVQQRIPGIRPGQRLTLHGFFATTNSNAEVPFYMLYTLGGAGGLKSFRPDLLGTDGTSSTLRGFRSYRFRDRDLVLLQAEYRVPLHRKVQATVFVDSGQVAPRRSELFTQLRTSTGFSLAYLQKGKPLGRVDFGFGGGEGFHVFWTFGGFLK
ncbi:MAG TPA: BamA/TamA family outer membrane protein [Vicinamibacterales bacterium]|nr:BamA/TamA family outer membrane protein [Vicinamibacterales bacterium]